MSNIITRSTGSNPKGAPLTAGELDSNFINLNADKVESTRAINTTAGDLTGGGDLSGDRTLGLASTGISAGTVQNSATQVTPLTLDIKGRVTAVGTPVTIAPDFSNVANKPTTLSGYGITDAQATITGAATTIDTEDLTASKVLVSNASGKVAVSDVSTTTLGYLDATSSVQGQLDAKQATTAKNAANGYAGLDANAKLPTSLLPALAISEYLGSAADQTARLALTGEKGDWCSQADNGKVYVITGDDPTSDASWTALTYPVTPGITLNGTSIDPGDTATITAATTNTLTIGTGLSGTSFDGSAAKTIAIDSTVVTLTGEQTLTSKTLTSPTINGGTGAFTTLSSTGNTTLGDGSPDTLTINAGTTTFAGTGQRITGDFSTGTTANRLMFQTSAANSLTVVAAIPSGTGAISGFAGYSSSDITNASTASFLSYNNSETRLTSGILGAGTYLPMTFLTGGREAMRIGATAGSDLSSLGIGYTSLSGVGEYGLAVYGKVGIGTSSPGYKLDVNGNQIIRYGNFDAFTILGSSSNSVGLRIQNTYSGARNWNISVTGGTIATNGSLCFYDDSGGGTRMSIDSSGNVGIGTSSPTNKLHVAGNVTLANYANIGATSNDTGISLSGGSAANNGGQINLRGGSFSGASSAIEFVQNGSERMRIDSSGNLLVGTTATTWNYQNKNLVLYDGTSSGVQVTNGTNTAEIVANSTAVFIGSRNSVALNLVVTDTTRISVSTAGVVTFSNYGAGTLSTNSSGVISASDGRYKTKTRNVESGLQAVLKLEPTYYRWHEDSPFYSEYEELGFIAQEVAAAIPEASPEPESDSKFKNYSDRAIIAMLVKSTQELHAEIELLKAKVN